MVGVAYRTAHSATSASEFWKACADTPRTYSAIMEWVADDWSQGPATVPAPLHACTFCPFAFANKSNRAEVFARYAADPAVGAKTLLMEHLAHALNPAQGLVGGRRLIDLLRADEMTGVLDAFDDVLAAQPHAPYDVRRILRPRKNDPTRLGNAARSVRVRMRGTHEEMDAIRTRLAKEGRAQGVLEREVGADASCVCIGTVAVRCSRRSNGISSSRPLSRRIRSTTTSISGGPALLPLPPGSWRQCERPPKPTAVRARACRYGGYDADAAGQY
ncbi:hypothetical protein [Rhodococcus wratislaviensis]|uniref:hypothetical protein n=1 Tax=Rhodococcus wratislaviensis TaxID=44752 RepID=UPI000F566121|nr:hypothetical protein [Rhodococcus wratislaviensis]